MIAKLIAYGKDRNEAIEKMIRAIDEFKITGVATTLPFCKFALQHEAFVTGKFDTRFVGLYFTPEVLHKEIDKTELAIAAVLASKLLKNKQENNSSQPAVGNLQSSQWRRNRTSLRG